MGLNDRVRAVRQQAIAEGGSALPQALQGVTKERIAEVLRALDRETRDSVDAIFALLDDRNTSWFAKPPRGATISDGATTAHIGCHVGILQRGGDKLDREGRDYWVKPLREIGAVDPVILDKKSRRFLAGHPVAKSPNSAYRLADSFRSILQSADWRDLLSTWIREDTVRERLAFQAQIAEASRRQVDTAHADLIRACCDEYATRFLPGFEVVYVDDGDGDRVSDHDKERLKRAGLELGIEDAMPDVLLWNPTSDELWVVEAVTSDGEVDEHKARALRGLAWRHHKIGIQFTTAYPTWKTAAKRQGKHKNIAAGTYLWIREDGSKHFRADELQN